MAYDEHLADRIRTTLTEKHTEFEEKKMMGGLCFMVNDKMCIGVVNEEMMGRIGPDAYQDALKKPGCKEMKFTGRAMKGFVFLEGEAIAEKDDLEYWTQLCLDYNPLAKSSKKR